MKMYKVVRKATLAEKHFYGTEYVEFYTRSAIMASTCTCNGAIGEFEQVDADWSMQFAPMRGNNEM